MTVKRIRIDRRGTRRESPWLEDLPARGRAARPPGLASPGLAVVLDERRQLSSGRPWRSWRSKSI